MQFHRFNIHVAGFSSDGDSRLLMAMRHNMNLDTERLFDAVNVAYIQDTIHEGVKLRSRLLTASIVLPMGRKQVSVSHLKHLIKTVPKHVHGLVLKDICPNDRQNYSSVEKIMRKRVLDALSAHVIDSDATIMYLRLCEKVTSSFRDPDIEPLERINRIWYAVFFYRIWRQWLKKNKYSVTENFITLNAYACVEINAHSLIHIVRKLRDDGNEHLFIPMLFDSQHCEQTFRQLRSMTTLNWTKVNFTVLELTHMISRIDLQNDIAYFKLKDTGIIFPRIRNRVEKVSFFPLPSDEEIKNVLNLAQQSAITDAKKFGMVLDKKEIFYCDLPLVNVAGVDLNEADVFVDDDEECDENHEMDIYNFSENEELNDMMETLNLAEESDCVENVDENSRFTQITDENGVTQIVQKSFVVWSLSNFYEKPSSDRLQRVRFRQTRQDKRRSSSAPDFSTRLTQARIINISDEIALNQWCMFAQTAAKQNLLHKIDGFIVGAITSFQYSTGKTRKEKQYSLDTAKVNNLKVQVLATWYKIKQNGKFIPIKGKNIFYVDIKNYFATIMEPQFDEKEIFISNDALTQIEHCLIRFKK